MRGWLETVAQFGGIYGVGLNLDVSRRGLSRTEVEFEAGGRGLGRGAGGEEQDGCAEYGGIHRFHSAVKKSGPTASSMYALDLSYSSFINGIGFPSAGLICSWPSVVL